VLDATSLIGGGARCSKGLPVVISALRIKETHENYVAGLLLSLRQPSCRTDIFWCTGYGGACGRCVFRRAQTVFESTLEGNHCAHPTECRFVQGNTAIFPGALKADSFPCQRCGVGVRRILIESPHLAIGTRQTLE